MSFLSSFPTALSRSKTSILFLLSTILTSSLLSACTKVPTNNMLSKKVPQTNTISVSITAEKQYKLGQIIPVTFILANGTNNTLRFLKWGTPFENSFTRNQFNVTHHGNTLSYQGRMIKRSKPTSSDYILINPRESLQTTVDISKAYPLNDAGQYAVNYHASYLDLEATQRLTPVKASNTVTFTVSP